MNEESSSGLPSLEEAQKSPETNSSDRRIMGLELNLFNYYDSKDAMDPATRKQEEAQFKRELAEFSQLTGIPAEKHLRLLDLRECFHAKTDRQEHNQLYTEMLDLFLEERDAISQKTTPTNS